MPPPYTAMVAVTKSATVGPYYGLLGGMWLADDFEMTGAQPTWRLIDSGLVEKSIDVLAVDPFDPIRRQFCHTEVEQGIYIRDTRVGDGWVKLLDKDYVRDTLGMPCWPAGAYYDAFTALNWIACDTAVPGRIYTIWSNFYIWPSGKYESYLLVSNDYGTTWSAQVLPKPNLYYGRGWGSVVAHGSNLFASVQGCLFGCYNVGVSTNGGASMLFTSSFAGSDGWVALRQDPGSPSVCYVTQWSGPGGVTDNNLIRVNADATYDILQDALELGSAYPDKVLCSTIETDQLWIDPHNHQHQRCLAEGYLHVTTDDWATVDSSTQLATVNGSRLDTIVSPSDDVTGVVVGCSWSTVVTPDPTPIFALDNETDNTPLSRAGTNYNSAPYADSIPEIIGTIAHNGIWVGTTDESGIYVYSVEMGEVGSEHGHPLHGDRSAWDVDGYPDEHASDIAYRAPHYHAPYPGAAGQVVRSDGSQWQSSQLNASDVGIEATAIGQVLMSLDGSTFAAGMPVTDPLVGWLIDGTTGYVLVS